MENEERISQFQISSNFFVHFLVFSHFFLIKRRKSNVWLDFLDLGSQLFVYPKFEKFNEGWKGRRQKKYEFQNFKKKIQTSSHHLIPENQFQVFGKLESWIWILTEIFFLFAQEVDNSHTQITYTLIHR